MYWNGDQFLSAVRRRFKANIGSAAAMLADVMRESVGEPYPPSSQPGDEPHRRTGGLQDLITSEEGDGLSARAGAPGKVAYWLETGTHKMAPRPFARPALGLNKDRVVDVATDGIGNREY